MVEEQLPTNTEINVNDLPPNMTASSKNGYNLPSLSKKLLILLIPVILLLAFVGGFFFTKFQNQAKLNSLVDQANQAYVDGNYDMALASYRESFKIKKSPQILAGAINSITSKGNISGHEQGAFEEAKPYIEIADKSKSQDHNLLLAVGYAYETIGEYEKALEYYEKGIKANPKSPDAWFKHGHALQFLGKNQESQDSYNRAFSLNPNNPLVLMMRGNMFLSQGNTNASFDSFIKASQTSGISNQIKADALSSAAAVKGEQENSKFILEAIRLSEEAVKADPNFSPGLALLGYNLARTGRMEEGKNYLVKSISANERISKNHRLLALVYRVEKNYVESINNGKLAISKVDNDNTILGGQSEKNIVKGSYLYDLAKTYDVSGSKIDVTPLLSEAIILNPTLKVRLKNDYDKSGFFSIQSSNQNFLNLLKQ